MTTKSGTTVAVGLLALTVCAGMVLAVAPRIADTRADGVASAKTQRLTPATPFWADGVASVKTQRLGLATPMGSPNHGTYDDAVGSHHRMALAVGDLVDFDASLQSGADYLRRMQADSTEDNAGNGNPDVPDDPDDGGWDWVTTTFSHSTSASPTNLYGVTALGMYHAYLESPDAALFTGMQDAADFIVAAVPPAPPRSGSDLRFLMLFNDLYSSVVAPTTVYEDVAKAKYDDRITFYGSATALAEFIRDVRGISQGYANGIIAWDIGIWAVDAQMLYDRFGGTYDTDADDIAEVLWQDSFNDNPGLFDIVDDAGWDPTYTNVNFWWYTLGLTGLIDAFDASGTHTAEIPALVTRLLDSQYTGGAISGSYGANTGDEDWQSTAYAMTSLGNLDQATYQLQINWMGYWTGATQDVSGGWVYGSGNHYPEIGGENTAGLYFTTNDVTTVIVDDDFTSQADVDVYNVANATSYVWGYDAFDNIQNGIDAVSGSTVFVAPGSYPGNISVAAGVSLESISGAASTTLAGAGGCAVTIAGDGVTIDGFTVTNPTGTNAICSTDHSTIAIRNNIVTDVGNVALSSNVHAVAIVSSASAVADVTIEDNEVNDVRVGPLKSCSAMVVGHTTGAEDVTGLLIQRNLISDVVANTDPWPDGHGAYGILLSHGHAAGKTVAAQVLNNTITDLEGLWAHGIGLEGNTPDAVVQGNIIRRLTDHKVPSDAVAIMVEDNASASSVEIHLNTFSDMVVGIQNKVSGTSVDAENNWWDSGSGPEDTDDGGETTEVDVDGCTVDPSTEKNADGTGTKVVDTTTAVVDYCPWLLGAGTLSLEVPAGCQSDTQITVELWMRDLAKGATGFFTGVTYDTGSLSYNSGLSSYTVSPFPLHITSLAQADDGLLQLDGSEGFGGPGGTNVDALLAQLVFDVDVDCGPTTVTLTSSDGFPPELSFEGTPLPTNLVDTPSMTLDDTDPVIACPGPVTVECDEPVGPSTTFGATGATTGGISVYFNAAGVEDLSNAAYIRTQVSLANLNGAEYFFDTTPLTGVPVVSWESIFSGIAPLTQFGLDMIRPLPTDDSTVAIPTLTAVDNVDSTPGGATPAGTVSWAFNDYKPFSPSGPTTPTNAPTNSIIRGPAGGDPMIDIEIIELELVGTTLTFAGKLDSDDTIYWFTPATPDSPMVNFGLNGDFYISGILELDSSGTRVKHYAGEMTVGANAPTATGVATATDNCTTFPAITFSDSVAAGACPQESVITRTWTATDDCGNSSTCDQIVTVDDSTAPDITCPEDQTVECDESTDPDDLGVTLTIPFDSDPPLSPTQAPGVWYTDRYPPFGFVSAVFDGDARLKHSIDASDCSPCRGGGFTSGFYDTQGRKYDLPSGTTRMTIDLYVPGAWASTSRRLAGFWGTGFTSGSSNSSFPIIEFTSSTDGSGVPRFRGWDNAWIDMGLPTGFVYDAWYTLNIELVGTDWVYTIGDLSLTVTAIDVGGVSDEIGNVILQGHNNTAGVTYDIYWDNFVAAESGSAQATDNCDSDPLVEYTDNVIAGLCDQESTIERTWTAEDECGNIAMCLQTIEVEDTTAPVLSACPDDIVVNADAGGCDAVVTWTDPTATDNCDPAPVVVCSPPSGSTFGLGTTVVTCTATDDCGNSSDCTFDVTVDGVNDFAVDIELAGVFNDALPLSRCIHFVTDDCGNFADIELAFTDHDTNAGTALRFVGTVEVGCGDWTQLCVKDEQHVLFSTATVTDMGTTYAATPVSLNGGDTDNDSDVDINDVTLFLAQFGDLASDGGCPWDGTTRDADFSNSGAVGSEDYTILTTNWLSSSSCACTIGLNGPGGSFTDLATIVDVASLPADIAQRADLNADGVVDYRDVRVFEKRHGLSNDLSSVMEASEKDKRRP